MIYNSLEVRKILKEKGMPKTGYNIRAWRGPFQNTFWLTIKNYGYCAIRHEMYNKIMEIKVDLPFHIYVKGDGKE